MKPLTPASPHAVIMIGIPGSGKSTFAEHFAETFQAPIINAARLASKADLTSKQANAVSQALLHEVLKTHRTFLFEGPTHTRAKRAELVKILNKAGFLPLIVWVQTETNEALRRAIRPYPKGSGLTEAEFKKAFASFQSPLASEKAIVISGRHTYASQLKIVLKQLASSRPESAPVIPQRPKQPRTRLIR